MNKPLSNDIPQSFMIIRGRMINTDMVQFGGRGGDLTFLSPDPHKFIDELALGHPNKLSDLYKISFEEILDYLEELGKRLKLDENPYLQQALELSYLTAPVTPPLLYDQYRILPFVFNRDLIRDMADTIIGINYLEGWVRTTVPNSGRTFEVRAFGSRTVHIVAGNSPLVSALTIIRNAITRSDAIIKSPSNDPFTALAIARTMMEIDPNHPITKHLSVAYWKGGDKEFESRLYQPHNIEKIVAWGGFAGIKHVTQYIQPGLELISLDPKRSVSIVGSEVFNSIEDMKEAAVRVATDVGVTNQNGCVCSRLAYVMTGSDEKGLQKANQLGQMIYDAMLALPEHVSTKPKTYNRELKAHVDAIRMDEDWYKVIGGEDDEGAVIVSQLSNAVDFAPLLIDRTLNVVPVETVDDIVKAVDAYTQTIGVYPESLKDQLKDVLPLYGAQRFVSLGFAGQGVGWTGPQDAIEPLRRMVKWIINEITSPEDVTPLWKGASIK